MRGSLKRSGGGEELAEMGVQAWKIMVLAHREENDLQKSQILPNTTREICVTTYLLLSWERSESQLLAQIFVSATKNDVEQKNVFLMMEQDMGSTGKPIGFLKINF